jgi:TP901 family phage tail tape measure protein
MSFGGASLGTAEGRITVDTSQAVGSLNSLGGMLSSFDAKAAQATGTTGQFTQSTVGLAQGMQHIGRVGLGLTAALEAPFIGAAKAAIDFEDAMTDTGAVMDTTEEQFTQLSDLAQQIGKDTIFSGAQAAEGMEELGKAGISTTDVLSGAAEAVAALAQAGETDTVKAAHVMAAAMQAFNIEGEDSIRVADALAGAANQSMTDVSQLGIGLGQVAGVANAANMSLEETTAFLALMADNGIRGSDAATSMKTAILALLSPTDKAAEAMAGLGIDLLDTEGNFIGLAGASQEFFDAWKDSGQTMSQFMEPLTDILGRDAVRTILFGMQALEDQQKGLTTGWDEYLKATSEAGAAEEFAAKRMDDTAGAIERLKGSIAVLGENMGLPLLQAIRPMIEGLTQFVNMVSEIPEPILSVVAAAGALAGGLTGVGSAILLVGGYLLEAKARFEAAGGSVEALIGTLARIGIGLSIVAAAVAAIGVAFNQNWFGIRDTVEGLIDKFQQFFNLFKQGSDLTSDLGKTIQAFGRALDVVTGGIFDFSRGFDFIANAIDGVAHGIENFDEFLASMKSMRALSKNTTELGKSIDAAGHALDLFFGTDISGFTDQLANAVDQFAADFAFLQDVSGFTAVTAAIGALGGALLSVFGDNRVSDFLLGLSGNLENLTRTFNNAIQAGANPFTAALVAAADAADEAGFVGLSEQLIRAAEAAQLFGTNFGEAFSARQAQGMNDLSAAIAALGTALSTVIGIDITGFTNRLAFGLDAALESFQTLIAQGVNPAEAAFRALALGIETATGIDVSGFFDSLGASLATVRDSVGTGVSEGISRIGEALGGIATAVLTGDWEGALGQVTSFVSDVQSKLGELKDQVGTIDLGEIVVTIAGFVIDAAQTIQDAIMQFVGGSAQPGGPRDVGASAIDLGEIVLNIAGWVQGNVAPLVEDLKLWALDAAGAAGVALESVVVNILAWAQGTIPPLAAQIQEWLTAAAGVAIPALQSVAVNILAWAQGTIPPIAAQIQEWLEGAVGVAVPALQSVVVNILSWAQGALPDLGAAVQSWIDGSEKVAVELRTWTLNVGTPIAENIVVNAGDIMGAIGTALDSALTVSEADVTNAMQIGDEIGQKLGQEMGKAVSEAITTALSEAAAAPAGPTQQISGIAPSTAPFTDAVGAFARELATSFADAFIAEAGPAFEEAKGRITDELGRLKTDLFNTAVDELFSPTGQPTGASNLVKQGAGFLSPLADGIPNNMFGPGDQAAMAEGTQQEVVETIGVGGQQGIETGMSETGYTWDKAMTDAVALIKGLSPFGHAVTTIADTLGPTEAEAAEAIKTGVFTPFNDAIPDATQQGVQDIGQGLNENVQSQAVGQGGEIASTLSTALDQAMSAQIQGITLQNFATAIGERINDAILLGVSQSADSTGGPGTRGEAGTASAGIGSQIATTLAGSIQEADFSAVGSAINTKIGESLNAGLAETDEGQGNQTAGNQGSSIGSSVASSMASSILQSDFAVVGDAINQQISSALAAGTTAEGAAPAAGADAAAAGAGIGQSVANSLAQSIIVADFTAVGTAIQQKISEAVSMGTAPSAALPGGGMTGTGGGTGGGIGNQIVTSIVTDIAGADWSGVAAALQSGLQTPIAATMQNITSLIQAQSGVWVASVAQSLSGLANSMVGAMGQIQGFVASAFQTITSVIQAQVGTWAPTVTTAMSTIGSAVTSGMATVQSAFASGMQAVTSLVQAQASAITATFQQLASTATSAGSEAGNGFASGIESGMAAANAAVVGAVATIESTLRSAAATAYGAGQAVGQGFADGISSMAGAVSAAAGELAAAVGGALGAAFNFGSPSKVTRKWGRWISEGLALGIEDGAPKIRTAMHGLAGVIIDSLKDAAGIAHEMEQAAENLSNSAGLQSFGSALDEIASNLLDAKKNIRDNLGEIFDLMNSQLKKGSEDVSKSASEVGKSVSEGIASASGTGRKQQKRKDLRSLDAIRKSLFGDLDQMDKDVDRLRRLQAVAATIGGSGGDKLEAQFASMAAAVEAERADAFKAATTLLDGLEKTIRAGGGRNREAAETEGSAIGENLATGISSSEPAVGEATQSLADQVVNTLNANLSRLPEMAEAMGSDIGQGLADGLDSAAPAMNTAGAGVGDSVGSGITSAIPDITSAADNAANSAVDSLGSAMETAAPEAFNFAEELGKLVGTHLGTGTAAGGESFGDALNALLTKFRDSLNTVAGATMPAVQQTGKAMGDAFTTGVSQTDGTTTGQGLVEEVGTGITQGEGTAVGSATGAGQAIGDSLASGVEAACKPANTAGAGLTESCIPEGIDAGLPKATQSASDAGKAVSDSLVGGLDVKKKDVRGAFQGAGNEFTGSMATGIGQKVQDAINSAKNVASASGGQGTKDAGNSAGVGVGSSIGQGIANGIIQQSAAVQEAARQVVREAENAAKNEAGAESPSRLFAELGKDLDAGLAMGMDRNAGMVIDAAGNLIDSASRVISGGGLSAAQREFNKQLGGYTDSIEDVLRWAERTVTTDRLPKSAFATISARGAGAPTTTQPTQQTTNININGVKVDAESPVGVAAANLVDLMRQTSGQY